MPDQSLTTALAETTTRTESFRTIAYWVAFFATSVYGHVALKLAVDRGRTSGDGGALSVLGSGLSWWGMTAYVAWGLSCLCWMLVLSRSDLMRANSISSFRYALIFAAAVLFLGESFSWQRAGGAALIAAGIYLVK